MSLNWKLRTIIDKSSNKLESRNMTWHIWRDAADSSNSDESEFEHIIYLQSFNLLSRELSLTRSFAFLQRSKLGKFKNQLKTTLAGIRLPF